MDVMPTIVQSTIAPYMFHKTTHQTQLLSHTSFYIYTCHSIKYLLAELLRVC